MSAPKATDDPKKNWTLTGSSWAGAWKTFAGIGVLGLAGSGAGYATDPRRFAFSWLFAFIVVLTITLGALFFVIIQRLVSAGWSVTVRRTAEFISLGFVPLLFLFIPVVVTMNTLFPWTHHGEAAAEPASAGEHGSLDIITPAYAQEHPNAGEHTAKPGAHPEDRGPHDATGTGQHSGEAKTGHANPNGDPYEILENEALQKKSGYLNVPFFLARAAFYFLVWIFLSQRLFKLSVDQDKSKDPKLTLAAQRLAPPATWLFGLTTTFAAFDWIMSLEPMWFSTIFGVVIFAAGVISSYAVIILVTLALRNAGPLKGAVTVEHYHDLGKLMFGFLVFWTYVSFAQLMLIWYAAQPEEVTFFHNRWDYAPWQTMSYAIIFLGFVLPFFWTISRWFKRNVGRLRIGALIILVMHVVDMYWYVMPNYLLKKEGMMFSWIDVACLLACVGIWGAFIFNRMTQYATVPVGDPRLQRSLEFVNA